MMPATAGVCRSREFWQEAVGMSRLTGHQDAQGRESEESPKTAPGNNGTGRHDAGRNPCTTASAAPLSTSPAASGWRRSTRRRSTPSVGRSRRMGGRRGAPPPRRPTPSPRMVCHPAEAAPGRAARRRHWPRCPAAWRSVGGRAHSLGPEGGPIQGRHWPWNRARGWPADAVAAHRCLGPPGQPETMGVSWNRWPAGP